jgi:hypothetical protein
MSSQTLEAMILAILVEDESNYRRFRRRLLAKDCTILKEKDGKENDR